MPNLALIVDLYCVANGLARLAYAAPNQNPLNLTFTKLFKETEIKSLSSHHITSNVIHAEVCKESAILRQQCTTMNEVHIFLG